MSPLRNPAAKKARAAPHQSFACPSGSKIGPGETSRRFSDAQRDAASPPKGGVSSCIVFKSDFRTSGMPARSEERRVGKECRSRWSADHEQKKRDHTTRDTTLRLT